MKTEAVETVVEESRIVSQINSTFERLGIAGLMKTPGVTEICINEPNIIRLVQASLDT